MAASTLAYAPCILQWICAMVFKLNLEVVLQLCAFTESYIPYYVVLKNMHMCVTCYNAYMKMERRRFNSYSDQDAIIRP